MKTDLELLKYKFAQKRVEELLPVADDNAGFSDEVLELAIMSDVVIEYEKKHFPIDKPSLSELIQLSLEEKGMNQKQLAEKIGVSQARISDYVSGRAEPTLRIARLLCSTLGIAPALILGS
ncbi:MAG: helix-turn-helix transcriptional regulator [Bacteroidales bacterium]|nr:helix-turn-helix transcriptional regulator [Bacteroidales bacterium]